MISGEEHNIQQKPEVVIKDAEIKDECLYGYAYAHPKLGEGPVSTSTIQSLTYDERAQLQKLKQEIQYMLSAPLAGKKRPNNHPFNHHFSAGQQVKVEWKGSYGMHWLLSFWK